MAMAEVSTSDLTRGETISPPYPYAPSWVDRFNTWLARLPGQSWLYYVGTGLALFLLQNTALWGERVYPVGTIIPSHTFIAFVMPIRFDGICVSRNRGWTERRIVRIMEPVQTLMFFPVIRGNLFSRSILCVERHMGKATFDFSGENVPVTGASKGIGREIALQFARAGCNIAAAGRDDLSRRAHRSGLRKLGSSAEREPACTCGDFQAGCA